MKPLCQEVVENSREIYTPDNGTTAYGEEELEVNPSEMWIIEFCWRSVM